MAFASSLDQIGPLTKTVEDAASVLQAIAGGDPMDSTCLDVDVPDYSASLDDGVSGLKIGVPREFFNDSALDSEVRSRVEVALGKLEGEGAELIEISLPSTEYAVAVYYILAPAEASSNLSRYDGIRYGERVDSGKGVIPMYGESRARGFGPEVKRRIILGTYVLSSGYSGKYYLKAQKARTLIQQEYRKAFDKVDVLMGPVSPAPARKIGEYSESPLEDYLADLYTISANLAGICGLSVPCGTVERDDRQLPVGLQILGPHHAETRILQAGRAWEKLRDSG